MYWIHHLFLVSSAVVLLGQPVPPTAEAIMDRFTQVTGGESAYRSVATEYAEAETQIPGIGKIAPRSWFTAQGDGRSIAIQPDGAIEESGTYTWAGLGR